MQPMELIDEVKGNYGTVVDVGVNSQGNRYYLFDRAFDSILLNGYPLYVLPKDTITSSPYYFGRPYLVGVEGAQPIFAIRPGGETLNLTDSSIFVITHITEDTLITTDTFFINAAAGPGTNLLLIEYNFQGIRIDSKHWQSPYNCFVQGRTMVETNSAIFLSGEYGGNAGGLLLDGHFLDIGSGNGNGFVGKMNNDKTMEWLRGVSGDGYQVNNMIAVNKKNQVLNTGASASSFVYFCEDSLENMATIDWGTDFLYFVQFDSSGQCINKKTIDYVYGNTIPNSITTLTDNSFVVSGEFNPTYIGFDSFYLFNPTNDITGFLVKMSDDLITQGVFQLQGSPGSKHIASMVSDENNNVWITGYTSADTLQVGNTILVANSPDDPMGFLARLDANFNVISAQKLEQGRGQKLIIGQDSNLYLLARLAAGSHKFFKVMIPITADESIPFSDKENNVVNVYPNPVSHKRRLINYELIQPTNESILLIHVYSINGDLIMSEKTNQIRGSLNLEKINDNLIFVEFITDKYKRITKKVLIN